MIVDMEGCHTMKNISLDLIIKQMVLANDSLFFIFLFCFKFGKTNTADPNLMFTTGIYPEV